MKNMLTPLESCGKPTQYEQNSLVFEQIGRFVGKSIEKCIDRVCNAIKNTKEL